MIRLLLILVALLLPPPAAAASCHRPPAVNAAHHHARLDQTPREREPVTAPHQCLGCASIGEWLRAPVAVPILPPAPRPTARIARIAPSKGIPPALPPPRAG